MKLLFAILFGLKTGLFAQSLTHPHIWVDNQDKSQILQKVNSNSWAQDLVDQYKSRVDPHKDTHKAQPSTILSQIPSFPGDKSDHNEALTLGYESALLYWLTGDNDYGQLAADILSHYTTEISNISGDLEFTTGLSYSHLIDTREFYTKPPMIYDFVHAFLIDPSNTVYSLSNGARSSFNLNKAQIAFIKMADEVFTKGSINSNHPILEAPGALFNLLSIENDSIRAVYLDKFMVGTPKQNGLTWMMDECKTSSLWPEATGYSIGPHRIILELMIVVDRYKPSLNVVSDNQDIIENALFFENYKFPDLQNVMRFGDAHRNQLNTVSILERVLKLSNMHSLTELNNNSYAMLQALYKEKGGYAPKVFTQGLEWNNPYYLLWGETIETTNTTPIDYARSINIDYAGIAMQRNINTSNQSKYGLMGYTGGAHYVHSHLTGIDMELYGLGAAIGSGGGDVGASRRDEDEFRNYHRIFAGHNTVIVNGSSKGLGQGAWKSDNQLLQQTTVTVAAEPISLQAGISDMFSFSSQELNDQINNAKQQRVLSVIRTSDSTGYYFDLFRSKSLDTNLHHDYIYHNVGDSVQLKALNTQNAITLSSTPTRYTSTPIEYGGKTVEFPGWHYFEDVKTSAQTTQAIRATIPMSKENSGYMHLNIPGGESREYSSIMGPATIEGQLGYEDEKTPVVSIRHYGEAWKRPFVSVFEPSTSVQGSVVNVENFNYGGKIVGTKVTSVLKGDSTIDYILSNIYKNDVLSLNQGEIQFDGRFGIIRVTQDSITLYIGDGNELKFRDLTLVATNRKGISTHTSVITQDTNQFTIETLWQQDSIEETRELIENSGLQDTLVTTLTLDIYLDSIFTTIDSLRNQNIIGSDTIFTSSDYRRDLKDSTQSLKSSDQIVSLIPELPDEASGYQINIYSLTGEKVFYSSKPIKNLSKAKQTQLPKGRYLVTIQVKDSLGKNTVINKKITVK